MEHNCSFNKQLRKEITARAVIYKKFKKLEADIDDSNEKVDDISQEITRIKKAIRRMRQKDRKYRIVSSRPTEINISKNRS